MKIAERIHSLGREQNDAALMIEAYRALAVTLYHSVLAQTALSLYTNTYRFLKRI
jgi:hypothetical protein